MIPAFPNAMTVEGFIGGLLIGLAAAIMLLGLGRIAGVSGLAARATGIADTGAPRNVAIAFVLGLPLGAFLIARALGEVQVSFPDTIWPLIIGGLLVGYGTRLGSGCTSGHGVCGLSRLSPRSMVATAMFMASGFVTVGLLRAGGWL
jgi:uncharacterized protein